MAHNYEHRQFMIFNINETTTVTTDEFGDSYTGTTSQLDNIDFNEVKETSKDTVRKSVDRLKSVIKWDSETIPTSVNNLIDKTGPYTYSEMITILSGTDWSLTEEI